MAIAATTHGYPFPPGTTDYDVYSGDCGKLPNPAGAFNIVQVTTGNITTGPNPCYQIEAHWAGPNRSAYIFMDGLMSPTPTPSCDVNCQSYSYGYTWAQHWVAASHGEGFYPNFFWLDVGCPTMPTPGSCTYLNGTPVWDPSTQTSNFAVISGAVAGLRAAGVLAGIYSTYYQWGVIAGSNTIPGIPLWVAGAEGLNSGSYSATSFCSASKQVFAGGKVVLVQYGHGSDGEVYPVDPDYACP